MRIIEQNNLAEVVLALQNGQAIVFPTETSYGLGCDAANQEAVDKIFKIKGRTSDKPLLVVVPTVEMAKKYLVWNSLLEDLANKYWPASLPAAHPSGSAAPINSAGKPGALTIVGEYSGQGNLATGVVAANNTIAVRVTDFPLTKFLSTQLGRPLVATSANLADAGNIYDSKNVEEVFSAKETKPDILINGGELPKNPPTTIVGVINNNLQILRQGQTKIS